MRKAPASLMLLLLAALLLPLASAQNNTKTLLEEADKLANDGKLTEARLAYEKAIKAGERVDTDYVRARTLALCYLNGTPQNFAEASKWFEAAIRLRPTAEDTRLLLAQSLAWGGKYPLAVQQWRLLLNAQPTNGDYIVGLSNTLYWKGDVILALVSLEQYLERSPNQVPVRLHFARMLGFAKRYPAALNQYQAVLQSDPNDLSAKIGIAKITSWQNQLDLALNMFNKILEKNPGYYDAVVGKAYVLYWMGDRDGSKKLFMAAHDRDPSDKEVAATLRALQGGGPAPRVRTPSAPGAQVASAKKPAKLVAKPEPPKPAVEAKVEPKVETTAPVVAQAPPEPPAPVDPVPGLLQDAENAAARSNYTQAIHYYYQALALKPNDYGIQLQIARVLSWSKNYADAVTQYDTLLKSSPDSLFAHSEKARVLSWDKKFPQALDEYRIALKLAEADPKPVVPIRDIRQEYARVLSWVKDYEASLAQYDILLPAAQTRQPSDVPVMVERARVLAWARQYDQSVATYDQAISLDKDNFDARLGKAQTTFWSGKLDESSAQLRDLLQVKPKHPEISFTLAAIEHGKGNNARSLRLLNDAPAGLETDGLRHAIRADMRPILRFRYGFEDDREISGVGNDSTTKVLRYTSSIEFSVHPDVRMEVINTFTNALSSNPLLGKHSGDAVAMETSARINFRVRPWLRLILGAGGGQTGGRSLLGSAPTRNHFTYDVHPVLTFGNLRTDIAVTRHIADYTPLAIYDNVVQERYSLAMSYTFRKRVRTGAEFWGAKYRVESPETNKPQRFDTTAIGGNWFITPTIFRNDYVTLDGGFRFDTFTYFDDAFTILDPANGVDSAGFFTPRLYQRVAATGRIAWDPHRRVHAEVNGTFGPQRIFGFAALNPPPASWGTTGSFGSQLTVNLGRFSPTLSYDYFSTETPASPALLTTGQWRSHVLSGGLVYRF
ncbi:MAG TPA: tetratricopeptide repeat protein [Terriglobales bacterium]|nr:tetratricopeptide repeat protein [Terriglobales bacterium]